MGLLWRHWSPDPLVAISLVVALWHGTGLIHLERRSSPAKRDARRQQGLLFYAGLLVLDLAAMSPLDYYADLYYWVHMVQHLLLMFAAPVLIVVGSPWLPLAHGLPVRLRRRLGRAVILGRWATPIRATGRFARQPWPAIVAFNTVMILWHLPGPFDLAYRNHAVHIWLMHGSFVLVGILFWLQFIGSYPMRPTLSPLAQAGALFGTNVVMFVLAMTIGMMATSSWYSVYDNLHGVTLSPLGDQQLGAGILWVCGDFWCFPALYRAVKEWIRQDESHSADVLLDRLLRGAR